MRLTRRLGAIAALTLLTLGPLAPGASAKVWFRVNGHVFTVGKPVRLVVPGCEYGCGLAGQYPGPIRIYLVGAGVPIDEGAEATAPPPGARPLGRFDDDQGLRFTPGTAGRFKLVALLPFPRAGGTVTELLSVSQPFPVHPKRAAAR